LLIIEEGEESINFSTKQINQKMDMSQISPSSPTADIPPSASTDTSPFIIVTSTSGSSNGSEEGAGATPSRPVSIEIPHTPPAMPVRKEKSNSAAMGKKADSGKLGKIEEGKAKLVREMSLQKSGMEKMNLRNRDHIAPDTKKLPWVHVAMDVEICCEWFYSFFSHIVFSSKKYRKSSYMRM
jgi:hypothetical protein